jgi:nucleoside-diphosphate-sugar epimerase
MNKILLTGASGFIGYHCMRPLLERGFEVHAISSKLQAHKGSDVIWHQADLLDIEVISKLIAVVQPTHLLHLAWYVTPGKAASSLDNFLWVQASLELLRQFYEHGGQRVVFVGSDYEYDWNYGFCSEFLTPRNPSTFYGACKNALYSLFEGYTHRVGLSGAWGRFFSLYGSNEHPARLVPTVIHSLLKREPARCSHGNQIRDYLYVQDAADALIALLDSQVTGPVNIASGQPIALKGVISEIARKLDGENLILLGAIPAHSNDTHLVVADINRLTNELGWKQRYNLDEGLEQTIEWWKTHLDKK